MTGPDTAFTQVALMCQMFWSIDQGERQRHRCIAPGTAAPARVRAAGAVSVNGRCAADARPDVPLGAPLESPGFPALLRCDAQSLVCLRGNLEKPLRDIVEGVEPGRVSCGAAWPGVVEDHGLFAVATGVAEGFFGERELIVDGLFFFRVLVRADDVVLFLAVFNRYLHAGEAARVPPGRDPHGHVGALGAVRDELIDFCMALFWNAQDGQAHWTWRRPQAL